MFTDGSRNEKGFVGAGWCWKPTEEQFSGGFTGFWDETNEGFEGGFVGLGQRCEVFDAELFAILRAVKDASRLREETIPLLNKLTVFSDSQEALKRLARDDESPGQALAREIWKWEESLKDVAIEYSWVPGHEGVPGNEIADIFAKRGAEIEAAHPFDTDAKAHWLTYSLSYLHRQCTENCKDVARRWVGVRLKGHKAFHPRKSTVFRPAMKPPWDAEKGEHPIMKAASAVFYQMACGHALTGAHLHRFKLKDSEGCGWCNGKVKQTRGHLFGACRGLRVEYQRLCAESNRVLARKGKKKRYRWQPWMFFTEEGLERPVIEYMRRTGVGFEVRVGVQGEG
jgi:ribonuclease HI